MSTWEIVKSTAKKYNQWYDAQPDTSRFWPLVIMAIIGMVLINSNSTIISFLGFVYFGSVIAARWYYLKGKL